MEAVSCLSLGKADFVQPATAKGSSRRFEWGASEAPHPASTDSIEELLGTPFHLEAGILLGLVARKPRDALHEIEDALCRA